MTMVMGLFEQTIKSTLIVLMKFDKECGTDNIQGKLEQQIIPVSVSGKWEFS